MNTGIHAQDLQNIKSCIYQHAGVEAALLFGSRAQGNYKYNSDIDIAIKGNLTVLACEAMKQDLENLSMPYGFDVLLYHEISNTALKQHIDRVGIPL